MGVLLHVVVLLSTAMAVTADQLGLLQVLDTSTGSVRQAVVVESASFGGDLPRVDSSAVSSAPLVHAQITDDCMRLDAHGVRVLGAAVLLDRGGPCSFVRKAMAAQGAGASLLVVIDTISGAYASAAQNGGRIYDCELSRAVVKSNSSSTERFPAVDEELEPALCSRHPSCATSTCVYTGFTGAHNQGFEVCCFTNVLIRMAPDTSSLALANQVTIPVVFAAFSDGQTLKDLTRTTAFVRALDVEENPWNLSMALTWLLGVSVVIGGAYCSATEERRFSYDKVASGRWPLQTDALVTQYVNIDDHEARNVRADPHSHAMFSSDDENDEERLELSVRHAFMFVIGSSAILVMLYYGHLSLAMNVLFMLASIASMAQVIMYPLLHVLLPLSTFRPNTRERVLTIASIGAATTTSVYWFINRANPHIWPLQDLLCISLCFVVIDSVQLPSLRVATVLLGVAFLYDIFFVYISPLIFGSSVMVEVASGGNMNASSRGGSHERLPMVLTVPLLFSYYGGDALLGLGDLVLPGLLVSFCIRFDYCMGYPLSRNYFMTAGVSYAVGLFLANIMAVALRNVVPGQPALMYIVPIMLGSIIALASAKEELEELWNGPVCLRMEDALVLGLKAETPVRQGEVEPFLKKS